CRKKPFRSQARDIVYNVYQKICAEEDKDQSESSILKRVQTLTGVSSSTIRRIVGEGRANGGVFSTPGKRRKRGKKKINLDSFDLEVIRNKIKEFYTVKKEIPTLRKLLQTLREDIDFNGGRESLRLILKNIGFDFVKCQSKRTILMDHDIKIQKFRYLECMKKNRESQQPDKLDVVYLDETYIHGSCSVNKCWQSKDIAGPSKSISTGARWIIVNAGGENGFVPNCCLIYRSKSISADYHHDMNQNNFRNGSRKS
ncbi:uncharacterized protein LOC123880459, partial [Maniola jurtina]|uniref:uncharacterized protein LOC123880459 n=1 Tax=Maniola jurtina TaxID=191418 RepID=UPI001E689B30